MQLQVIRLLRFGQIYGPRRALLKALGRMRRGTSRWIGMGWFRPPAQDIGVLGCGQFAFSSIGYVIGSTFGRRFNRCYDPDVVARQSFARFWGCEEADSIDAVLSAAPTQVVYIASNHASHAPQAIAALNAGLTAYVEKPVAVNVEQFAALKDTLAIARARGGALFAGYNRPFSQAVADLRNECARERPSGPMTLACIVQGHDIPVDHWYREPQEGTRIAGNVGHWLDLAGHMLAWHGDLPEAIDVDCRWSSNNARDDNLAIALSTPNGDLVSIVLTARSEPYEGIRETIVWQWGELHAEIDDFRSMTVRRGRRLVRRRYRPKDVGHRRAILQPFADKSDFRRDFREVEWSTALMLHIVDQVRTDSERSRFIWDCEV